jgi:hypothetical protein
LGVRNLLQWRNRSGFSPDSLTFDCEFDELAFTVFKERYSFTRAPKTFQELSEKFFDLDFVRSTAHPAEFCASGSP